MKIGVSFLALVISVSALFAEGPRPAFAASGRIVTVEQWHGGTGVRWKVWAVQKGRIVVYLQYGSSRPAELFAEVPIRPDQEALIRSAAAKLRADHKGMSWFRPDVSDGLSLRVLFSPDGASRYDDVSLENAWRPEFRDLCVEVSAALPQEHRIAFQERIESDVDLARLPVQSISIEDQRAGKGPTRR